MKERRRFDRYSVALPARMATVLSEKKQVFDFKTRDISSLGAFIETKSAFPEGTRFKMDVTVSSERIKMLTGAQGLIECEGNVVRSTPQGMAVCFDKECQIYSLKGL